MSGPLSGLRVVDFSIMAAGPWTASLLGQLGADVIKVEPPAGDSTRWVLPTQYGMGTNYIALNANKRAMVLDLKDPSGRQDFLALCRDADVLIQNFTTGVVQRLGVDFDAVTAVNPRLVYCSISGFGSVGPLGEARCADYIAQAFSGFARLNGQEGETLEQFRFSGFLDLSTGANAARGILAALFERETSGLGQHVEVSMLESALEMQFTRVAEYLDSGLSPEPSGSESGYLCPDGAYATSDHELFLTVHDEHEWQGLCDVLEKPELLAREQYRNNVTRVSNRKALRETLESVLRTKPAMWWIRALRRRGVPCALPYDFEMLQYHQQVLMNEMLVKLKTKEWKEVTLAGVPWKFDRTPCTVWAAPIPNFDTETVKEELRERASVDRTYPSTSPRPAAEDRPILENIVVVELASGVAGPLAALRLQDLGAKVYKFEDADGDWMRGTPLPKRSDGIDSVLFAALNRDKTILPLVDADDRSICMDTIKRADVVITDCDTAEIERLGLADVLRPGIASAERLVVVTISDFGEVGPMAGLRGSELIAQAVTGYTRYLGSQKAPSRRLGADVAGVTVATHVVEAVLAALLWRARSGLGQRVSTSMWNSLLSSKAIQLTAQGDPDVYKGPRVGGAQYPPERGWRTADVPVTFAFGGSVGSEGRPGWEAFVSEVGLERLINDDRCDSSGRKTTGLGPDVAALRGDYESAFSTMTSKQVVEAVRRHSGMASAYQGYSELFIHPQMKALQILVAEPGRETLVTRFPASFSRSGAVLMGGENETSERLEQLVPTKKGSH